MAGRRNKGSPLNKSMEAPVMEVPVKKPKPKKKVIKKSKKEE